MQQRSGHRDAGIVDQARQGGAAQHRLDLQGRLAHGGLVGDVEDQGGDGVAERCDQGLRVGGLSHAAEHVEALLGQNLGHGPADAGRDAGDDDGFPGLAHGARSPWLWSRWDR